jgi:hypothetical protein
MVSALGETLATAADRREWRAKPAPGGFEGALRALGVLGAAGGKANANRQLRASWGWISSHP